MWKWLTASLIYASVTSSISRVPSSLKESQKSLSLPLCYACISSSGCLASCTSCLGRSPHVSPHLPSPPVLLTPLQSYHRIIPVRIQLCYHSSCYSHNALRLVSATLNCEAGDYRAVITGAGSFQPSWFVLSFNNLLASQHSQERYKHGSLWHGSSQHRWCCATHRASQEILHS